MISNELLEFLGNEYTNLPNETKLGIRFIDYVENHLAFYH